MGRRAVQARNFARGSALALALAGCGDPSAGATESDTGGPPNPQNPNPHVRVRAVVDVFELCGPIGSTHLSLRATRINCEKDPPPPCTIAKNPYEVIFGDTRSCELPTETEAEMFVELEATGRYLIEVVTLTESGEVGTCYGTGGQPELVVGEAALEARDVIDVDTLGSPCPSP